MEGNILIKHSRLKRLASEQNALAIKAFLKSQLSDGAVYTARERNFENTTKNNQSINDI